MIRPIGNRLLVLPLSQDEANRQLLNLGRENASRTVTSKGIQDLQAMIAGVLKDAANTGAIHLVETKPPVVGHIVAMGKPFCSECQHPVEAQFRVGDLVVFKRTAGLDVQIDDVEHLLMVPEDILLIWRSEKESAA